MALRSEVRAPMSASARRTLLLGLVLSAVLVLQLASIRPKGLTYDEPMHHFYAERVLTGDAWRTYRSDNSKMPVTALNVAFGRLLTHDAVAGPVGKLPLLGSFLAPFLADPIKAGRIPTMFAGLLLLVAVYRWSRELYGPAAGVLSLAVAALSPTLLAHARLVTTDVWATCAVAWSSYLLWRLVKHGRAVDGMGGALAFGLGLLAKYTCAFLGFLFPALLALRYLRGRLVRPADGEVRPSLALAAAWMHTHGGDHAALLRQLAGACDGSPMVCGHADLGLPALPGPLHEPLEINFRGPEGADGIPAVDAARALRVMGECALLRSVGVEMPVSVPDDLAARLAGKVVVVCRVDGTADDRFVTPYSFPLLMGTDMAGGRVQAQLIDSLLGGTHVRHVGAWSGWLLALALAAGVVATRRRLRDDVHTIGWLALTAGLLLLGVALFRLTDGLTLDLGLPITVSLVTLLAVRVHAWALEDQVAD